MLDDWRHRSTAIRCRDVERGECVDATSYEKLEKHRQEGGGALGNFASHSIHYLEWLCGSNHWTDGTNFRTCRDPSFETNVTLVMTFDSGASGSYVMSSGSFLGSGHRLEFYGEDGMLVLTNATADYMRGFGDDSRAAADNSAGEIPILRTIRSTSNILEDGRIAPVSRLAKRFLDAIELRQSVE